MALKLDTQLPIGIIANYWRIVELSYNYTTKQARCLLGLYLSKEVRDNDASSVRVAEFVFKDDDFDALTVSEDDRKTAYQLCKRPRLETPQPDSRRIDAGEIYDPTPVNINPFVNAADVWENN
jgi:hypothetical protein